MLLNYLASEGGIDLLHVNPGLVIWTLITFTIVLLILWRFAWKPIVKALDERAGRIHSDLERAEQVRRDAEAKLEEYMGKLNGLRAEGQEIMAEARKDAEEMKEEIGEAARKEAEAIKTRGVRDIQLAMDKALEEYHRNITELSVAIAGQILDKTLSTGDYEKLVSESIAKIKSLN